MENDKKKWFHFYLQYRKEEKEKINIQVYFKNQNTLLKITKSSYIPFEILQQRI